MVGKILSPNQSVGSVAMALTKILRILFNDVYFSPFFDNLLNL